MFFKKNKIVNIVNLSGIIASSRGKKFLSLNNVKAVIDKAFSTKKNNTFVAVIINSPGGSPSESEAIANYLQYKSKKTNIKFATFIDSVAASGGYWIAVASSEVYSLSNTAIVGSIGVVSSNFGLNRFIDKHFIDRRLYTAGKSKVSLDMFLPEKPEERQKHQEVLDKIHTYFKNWILLNRSEKLTIAHEELFTGDIWLAADAVQHGLIDGIVNTLQEFCEDRFGKNVVLKEIKSKKSILSNLPFASKFQGFGSDVVDAVFDRIEKEQIMSKFNIR